jgi:hypothetical protein
MGVRKIIVLSSNECEFGDEAIELTLIESSCSLNYTFEEFQVYRFAQNVHIRQ